MGLMFSESPFLKDSSKAEKEHHLREGLADTPNASQAACCYREGNTMQQNDSTLRFVFQGRTRPWNPMKGRQRPEGQVSEVRSIPGNLVAWAATEEEATSKLQRLLELAFKRSGSAASWYADEFAQLSPADAKIGEAGWGHLFTSKDRVQRFANDEAVFVPQDYAQVAY